MSRLEDPWGDLPWVTSADPIEPDHIGLDESCTHTTIHGRCACDHEADRYYRRFR